MVKTVFIPFTDIVEAKIPASLVIILKLIDEGAPIELLRENKFDVSEITSNDYKFTGTIEVWTEFEKHGLCYRF